MENMGKNQYHHQNNNARNHQVQPGSPPSYQESVQTGFPPSYQQNVPGFQQGFQPGFQPVIQTNVQPVIQTVQQPVYQQQPLPVVVMKHLPTNVPGQMKCPYCNVDVVTRINHKPGCYAWTCCAVLGVFLLWPFCLIPFCVKDCHDVEHSCPTCNAVIHIHKR